MRSFASIVLVMSALTACESDPHGAAPQTSAGKKPIEVQVEGTPTVKGSGAVKQRDFDLEGTAALVRDSRVKDGKGLEAAINKNPKNRVDVDRDGKKDRLQVVEVRDENERTLEIRAIPSSKGRRAKKDDGVDIAEIEFVTVGEKARVTAEYAPIVVVESPVHIVFESPLVVESFCYWVLVIDRPIFIGVPYVIVEVHETHGKHKHKKHKKHKK
jgi:hypothetical protein